ncbi:hypothetical protein psal_cds_382 [Pandoravirus salinus]|uniref:Uncharacterized protein n=1 Tax=Pandoravirus salinus TaxID=1349410 RepID=S4VUP2_9VIRU|nr:hypothetical protein psal_cds_382 [Pandoravirus salinus]AGO84063.1 hypothetical protein psal_cds_382 [Pandoravirus salinus]
MAYYDPDSFLGNGAFLGMEPGAFPAAYARAPNDRQPPAGNNGGRFRGIAQPPTKGRTARARTVNSRASPGAFFDPAGDALPQYEEQPERLSGGFRKLVILGEQPADPATV